MFLSLFFLFFICRFSCCCCCCFVLFCFFSIISKSKRYSMYFAFVRVGCSAAVFFAVFSKVSEVVLIFSKYHLQIWLKLLITTSESYVEVRFVGNGHYNSHPLGNSCQQRCRVVICELSCFTQEIKDLSAYCLKARPSTPLSLNISGQWVQ